MVDYQAIYGNQGELYDRLVEREDYEGNLLPALLEICPFAGSTVVDLGAGTGRFARLLGSQVQAIVSVDRSEHMLKVARSKLEKADIGNFLLAAADSRYIPLVEDQADIVIAGWSIGHSVSWYGDRWQPQINGIISEMMRAVRPEGTVIIIETMGTGQRRPAPPTEGLAKYYELLEEKWTFQKTWVRTDYKFRSTAEAIKLCRFFFGEELARRVKSENLTILPECTGIWWKKIQVMA